MIAYLLKVALIQAIGIGMYRWMCHTSARFTWNRFILLGLLVGSLLAPALQIEMMTQSTPTPWKTSEIAINTLEQITVLQKQVSDQTSKIDYSSILEKLYILITCIMLLRYLVHLFKLIYNPSIRLNTNNGIQLYSTTYPYAFSFFNRIYIPESLRESHDSQLVILHEQQHARLGHSWDRILIDGVIVLLWFNPFTFLIRKYLIEIHEFEADAYTVSKTRQPLEYQLALLNQAVFSTQIGPFNYFSFSNTKRRLQMINNQTNKKWTYRMIIPVMITLMGIFSFDIKNEKQTVIQPWSTVSIISINQLDDWILQTIEEIPSILPIQCDNNEVKITSGWGKRMDPISKEEKYHFGIDIKASRGTPVIATAGGTVVENEFQPNGYGNFIIIEHTEDYRTRYAQLEDIQVTKGEKVQKGQVIGTVGSSGRSTAPHLHYEVMKGEKRVNPVDFIGDYKQ